MSMTQKKSDESLRFPQANAPHFQMIDVGRKRPTRRRAVASGRITMGAEAFAAIKTGTLPKGNVLALAEAAGISGAKKTPELIPMCHTLPLDQVTVHCHLDDADYSVTVYAQAAASAKTGVEMEALTAANIALLTIWDLTKGVDPDLMIEGVKLLVKTGGKSGVWVNPAGIPDWLAQQLPDQQSLKGQKIGIITMSDRASRGDYEDLSGKVMRDLLADAGAEIVATALIPDDRDQIAATITRICREDQPSLLMACGGTGPGPRDVTPDVLEQISDRMMHGLGDLLRAESLHYTDTAWLSRMTAAMVGATLVVAFPGSPKAVKECWEVIAPFIGNALGKIKKQGYESIKNA